MVFLIDHANAAEFRPSLKDMHRVRKQVFADWLGWDVPVVDGEYEIDQFDTDDAIYLLNVHQSTRQHLASVRLLPSMGPHILGDLFGDLCEGGAPRDPATWEITRLCVTPGMDKEIATDARKKLAVALVEFALLNGIKRYTCVIQVEHISALLAPGWQTTPLGPPKRVGDLNLGAFALGISPTTLEQMAARWGGSLPALQLDWRAAA